MNRRLWALLAFVARIVLAGENAAAEELQSLANTMREPPKSEFKYFLQFDNMNAVLLSFADGTSFFVGLGMVLIAGLLLLRFRNRFIRFLLTLFILIGIVFGVASATPLPIWVYALWLVTAMTVLVLGNLSRSLQYPRFVAAILLFMTTVGLCLAEAPYHHLPRVTVPKGKKVYVLGDSISAVMGTTPRCWPMVLAGSSTLAIVNLAQPGATVQNAIRQAENIIEPNSMVIVEIGGNDLLGGTDAATFRSRLDSLVSALRSHQHQVLIIEIPLFPFQNAFGKAQRSIASKYGAVILPKRYFTKVLGAKEGTLAGLHLSQQGHNVMAEIMARVLQQK